MSILIKGLNIKPCKDGFDGKGLVIIGYDDKLYAVAHEQIIPLPDHGDLIDRSRLIGGFADWYIQESPMYLGDSKVVAETIGDAMKAIEAAPVVIPAERSEDGNGN